MPRKGLLFYGFERFLKSNAGRIFYVVILVTVFTETYEQQGVYVGLVGARFEKPSLMEWQHIIVTHEQNTTQQGYGLLDNHTNSKLALWSKLYDGLRFATFAQAQQDKSGRYISFDDGHKYFDSAVYKKRMRLVIEPFVLDAHERGKQYNKKVYSAPL